MQVFQAGSNQIQMKQESRAAKDKSDGSWTGNDSLPFPFIATGLYVGSSFDLYKGYQGGVHVLAFNTTLDQVHNNDGITIVDKSNPEYIHSSFNILRNMGKGVKPLSAYMCRYKLLYNNTSKLISACSSPHLPIILSDAALSH